LKDTGYAENAHRPTEEYSRVDAQRAIADATWVVSIAAEVIPREKPQATP
jgi:hypothetical protein